jgi:glycosyltransferase involved in cell wall biosynthesis
VPENIVGLYMQAADAYVQPSLLEGLANATMEAMATGLPVIATDTCGQREAVRDGENGWLVPTGDVSALVAAMEEVSDDSNEARRRGAAARRTIEGDFDPAVHAQRLKGLLEALVRRPSASVLPPSGTQPNAVLSRHREAASAV